MLLELCPHQILQTRYLSSNLAASWFSISRTQALTGSLALTLSSSLFSDNQAQLPPPSFMCGQPKLPAARLLLNASCPLQPVELSVPHARHPPTRVNRMLPLFPLYREPHPRNVSLCLLLVATPNANRPDNHVLPRLPSSAQTQAIEAQIFLVPSRPTQPPPSASYRNPVRLTQPAPFLTHLSPLIRTQSSNLSFHPVTRLNPSYAQESRTTDNSKPVPSPWPACILLCCTVLCPAEVTHAEALFE